MTIDTSIARADRPLGTLKLAAVRTEIREMCVLWADHVTRMWARVESSETDITDTRPYTAPDQPLSVEVLPFWVQPGLSGIRVSLWHHIGGGLEAGSGNVDIILRLITRRGTYVSETPLTNTTNDEWTIEDCDLTVSLPGLYAPELGVLSIEIRTSYDDTVTGRSESLVSGDTPSTPTRVQVEDASAGGGAADDMYLDPRSATYPDQADTDGDVWLTVTRIENTSFADIGPTLGHIMSQSLQFDPNDEGMRVWPLLTEINNPGRAGDPDRMSATLIASSYIQIAGLELRASYDPDVVVGYLTTDRIAPGQHASGALATDYAQAVDAIMRRRVLLGFGQRGDTGASGGWSTRGYRVAWLSIEGSGKETIAPTLKPARQSWSRVDIELALLGVWYAGYGIEVSDAASGFEQGVVGAVEIEVQLYQRQAGVRTEVGQTLVEVEVGHVPLDVSGSVHHAFVELCRRRAQPTAWNTALCQHEGMLEMGKGEGAGSDTELVVRGLRTVSVTPTSGFDPTLATEVAITLTSLTTSGTQTYPYLADGGGTDDPRVTLDRLKVQLAGLSMWGVP
jgi:hypothetical protein